jgi:hypothetical protein
MRVSSTEEVGMTSLAVAMLLVKHGRVSRQHASILNLKDTDSSVRPRNDADEG